MNPKIYQKSDFSEGQKVYLLICEYSNASRHIKDKDNIENWILEAVVSSIGRKYISVDLNRYSSVIFDMTNNWRQYVDDGSPSYILFISKQEALEAQELKTLYNKVRNCFSTLGYPFTLEQMKAIYNIISKIGVKK